MGGVVHFEIPVDDRERAKKFYAIFDWELDDQQMGDGIYTIARTVPVDDQQRPKEPGAINGGLMQRSDKVKGPVVTISVSSIDDYAGKVEAAGGSVVTPKTEIPGMGFYAYITDTEGNVVGLWQTT